MEGTSAVTSQIFKTKANLENYTVQLRKRSITAQGHYQTVKLCREYLECFRQDFSAWGHKLHGALKFLLDHIVNSEIRQALLKFQKLHNGYKPPEVLIRYCEAINIVGLLLFIKISYTGHAMAWMFNKGTEIDPFLDCSARDVLVHELKKQASEKQKKQAQKKLEAQKQQEEMRKENRRRSEGTAVMEAYDLKRTGRINQNMHLMTPNHQKMLQGPRKILTVKRKPKAVECWGCAHNEPNQMAHECCGYGV